MIGDASSSNPPPLPSELLAPGFRFHPTDEELVSYYLKRKVSGRPLRVDAIAEVDLYKAEPWDLPAMSRLRSRDMEWYFFSPLDRKYANRSRTNRATAQGYWKTTGKDRPVGHGPRTVGMKKTLVFHVGRAPRGERTDWVMHEYRLEDEELARAGIPQDAYVVCRIFQKSGPGPQNGAQYGGMFMEEEWEEADDLVLAVEGCTAVTGSGAEEYLQLTDFAHSQEHDNQHEHNHLLTAIRDGQNPEDPFLLETFQDQNFIDMNASGLQDSPILHDGMGGNSGITALPYSPLSQNDGYMELNDIVETVTVEYPSSEDSVDCFLGTCNGQISMNRGDESNKLAEVHEVEEFFDIVNENTDSPLFQTWPDVQDGIVLEPNDLMYPTAGDYPSDQTAEDNMLFYDAPSNDLPFAQDNFVQMNDLLYSPTADSSGFNLVDDIMAYFDRTENNLHYSDSYEKQEPVDSSVLNESNFALEVGGSSVPAYETKHQPSEVNPGMGASSLVRLLEADNQSNGINEEVNVAPDSEKEKDCGRTLTKRLANMLGSISAPPAYASEWPTAPSKSSGQISATTSGGSIHFTTGMIEIQGFRVMGRAEHWSLHKNVDVGFHLSYGMASGGAVSRPGGFVPVTKMQGWSMSVVLRGGFYLFLLSALFLAVGFKVGMCVCKR